MNGYMENKVAGVIELNRELNEKANRACFIGNKGSKTKLVKNFSENFKSFYNTLLLSFVI